MQVRLLHLADPAHLVMGILGKKYPANKEEWRAARLPGQFELKRAGKRMALAVPETWETQVTGKLGIIGIMLPLRLLCMATRLPCGKASSRRKSCHTWPL